MSKTLSNILTVFKVAKIIAKVVFILSIIGGVGSLVSLVTLPFASVVAEIFEEGGAISSLTYSACIVGALECASEAICAFFAEKYFGHVLESGTPFTVEGSKECFKFGLISIITSASFCVAYGIVQGIFMLISQNTQGFEADVSISLTTGLLFMFMSLIFKYGAELTQKTEIEVEETETEEDTVENEQV